MPGIPDALERRELLYGRPKRTPDYQALGRLYEEAGILSDACEAYERVSDEDAKAQALNGIKKKAIDAGDWFVLRRVANAVEVPEADWRTTLDMAVRGGKLRYALKIAERLEDAGKVRELQTKLGIAPPEVPEEDAEGGAAEASEGDAAQAEGAESE